MGVKLRIILFGIILLAFWRSASNLLPMNNIYTKTITGLSQDRVLEILKPHLANLSGSVTDAWSAWETFCQQNPGASSILSNRTRASFIYDYMRNSAMKRFDDVGGVSLSHGRGFLAVTVCDQVVIRFKKLDKNRRARGVRTKQYELFMLQGNLEGFDQVNLVAGYRVDALQTQIAEVLIVCPSGSKNLWYVDVTTEVPAQIENIVPAASDKKPVIRAIKSGAKQSEAR
jgi:hypothetical protein